MDYFFFTVLSPGFNKGAGRKRVLVGPTAENRPKLNPLTKTTPLDHPSVSMNVSASVVTVSVALYMPGDDVIGIPLRQLVRLRTYRRHTYEYFQH